MKIVMLDRNSIGFDIDVNLFSKLGDFEYHNTADVETSKALIKDADVVIFNKTKMNEEMLTGAPKVKLLCVTATGFDNIDLEYAKKRGIAACNIKDYSTPAVVQHTFALALSVLEKIRYYDDYVKSGAYSEQMGFSHFEKTCFELQGKTWGIIGLGAIGRRVANIAKAFGANVIYYSTSGANHNADYQEVDFDTLLQTSDIVSVHAPLTEQTRCLMNANAFSKMKPSAIFLNLGRGDIVVEKDLAEALNAGQIAAAGLDVLSKEPMSPENPLVQIKDSRKLFITPHIAWASVEARTNLMNIIMEQIRVWKNSK